MLRTMNPEGSSESVLETLTDRECLRLMASVPVGRIVYTVRAMPAVEPVNFVLDNGQVVFRTEPGSKLAAAVSHSVVAFQADQLDSVTHTGWSVTIVGTAQEVSDPAEVARLQEAGLVTWVPGERKHFVRVEPGVITGRRLRGAGWARQQRRTVP